MTLVRRAVAVLATTTMAGSLLVFDVVGLPTDAAEVVEPKVQTVALAGVSHQAAAPSSAPESSEPGTSSDPEPVPARASPAPESSAPESPAPESPAPDTQSVAPSATAGSPAAEQPSEAGEVEDTDDVPSAMQAPDETVLETDVIRTQEFSVLGVTWDSESDGASQVSVEARVLENAGWSEWTTLELTDSGPDAGTPEHDMAYDVLSTEPLVAASADAVQVRLTTPDGQVPEGAEAVMIDPGTAPSDETLSTSSPLSGADASLYKPRIITRSQWGADESRRRCKPGYSSTLVASTVHHTAGSNGYSSSQSAGIVRGIYAYHTGSLGWCDVGYNALVDRFGTIYEGRYGGIERAVRGAHAGGFNDRTFGVAAMGNYDVVAAPSVMVQAIGRVIGWKLGLFDRNPAGTTTLTSAGGGTARYSSGSRVTLPTVFTHRDVGYTACPGRYVVDKMSTVRKVAGLYSADAKSATVVSLDPPAGGRSISLAYNPANGRVSVGRLQSDGTVKPTYEATWATGWEVIEAIEADGSNGSEVLVYNPVRGVRQIMDVGNDSRFTTMSSGNWSKGWDVVLPVNVDSTRADELLVYNSTTGRRWILRVSPTGGLKALHGGGWSKGWDVIVDVETDQTRGAEIVTYNSTTGRRWLLDLSSGGGTRAITGGSWSKGWGTVVGASVPGRSGSQLLFHNQGNGRQTVVGISRTGALSALSYSTWPSGYGEVLTTEFDSTGGDEVIYFNPRTERVATADVKSSGTVTAVVSP